VLEIMLRKLVVNKAVLLLLCEELGLVHSLEWQESVPVNVETGSGN
jgi:hypothetical protein